MHEWSIASVMSDSLQPHGLQPARLLCPWDSPGKNTGVCCHFLLQQIVLSQGSNPHLLYLRHCRWTLYRRATSNVQTGYYLKALTLCLAHTHRLTPVNPCKTLEVGVITIPTPHLTNEAQRQTLVQGCLIHKHRDP